LEWPPVDPSAFRSQLLTGGMAPAAGIISPDGQIVTLPVVFSDLAPPEEREFLDHLYRFINRPPPGINAHISGLPILHLTMDRSLVKMAGRFLPLLVFVAIAFLVFIFRRLWDVCIPLIFVAVCQSILFGIMGYLGVRLNLVNIILAPLIFVIALATAVHLLVSFRDTRQKTEKNAAAVVEDTYRVKGWPVLWTGVTTLVAFGSLVTGIMPPLRSLGIWSALGIAIMTILAFTFYPVLLAGIRQKPGQQPERPFETWARRNGRTWATWAIRRRLAVLIVMAVVFAAAVLGLTRLDVEDNLAHYFSPHHPVRAQLEKLQQSGIGVFSAEVFLSYRGTNREKQDEDDPGFQEPWSQQRLAQLTCQLRSEPLIYGAAGSGDLVEFSLRSLIINDEQEEISENTRWMALGMLQTAPDSRKLLQALLTPDGQSTRITLLVPVLSFNRLEPLFERIKAEAATFFPGAKIWITGQYPLILLAQQKLLSGLILALSITLLCVALVLWLLLRSVRLTLLVLLPNLWPVVLVLGGMGLLNVSLDSVSIMTASIVLGLAVDDTFHTLGYFLKLAPKLGRTEAIAATLERTAPAHILTSVILASGFAACTLSVLVPVSRMGALSAVAIALALIGDLLLIPALLHASGGPAARAAS
jgi:predicted RND superfamily exporter protein